MKHNTDDILKAIATREGVSEEEVKETLEGILKASQGDSEASEHPANLEAFLQNLTERSEDNRQKLLMARDGILAYLMKMDFWVDESKLVLQMCLDELNAWEKRSEFDVM